MCRLKKSCIKLLKVRIYCLGEGDTIKKKASVPVILATREAAVGESFKPKSSRPTWATLGDHISKTKKHTTKPKTLQVFY
jgi:hypothetical protein